MLDMIKKPTLLIMAAGTGSRYGGVKQIDAFGPSGETIMDYSLYDAIRAGFGKVVFIIREELREDFEKIFIPRLSGKIEVAFAIQGYDSYLPEGLPQAQRDKPWGTGHAVLCAWGETETPFAVINADDFYGREAFVAMAKFLAEDQEEHTNAMVGYKLKNTLSENGLVSRGVCSVGDGGLLTEVIERTKIARDADGGIAYYDLGEPVTLNDNTLVSMNFWGFKPYVFPEIERMFHAYAKDNFDNPKSEFYIPKVMATLIEEGKGQCKVFTSASDWFGVTYSDDKEPVRAALNKLVEVGEYPSRLWGN